MAIVKEMFTVNTVIMGKRGEILPKKRIREELGFQPGDELSISVENGKMVIRKIPTVEDLFNKPRIASGTPQYFKELARKEMKEQFEANKEFQDIIRRNTK